MASMLTLFPKIIFHCNYCCMCVFMCKTSLFMKSARRRRVKETIPAKGNPQLKYNSLFPNSPNIRFVRSVWMCVLVYN